MQIEYFHILHYIEIFNEIIYQLRQIIGQVILDQHLSYHNRNLPSQFLEDQIQGS
ncbi:unnamed protein product [Paramecium pentaurelia]|uniref:Uncharacterized protein n=1 Tax=Paramecium pentaurelia TaxID=43138 RepID=A0A8S1SPX2_9CILI|nr:unnamed protein product [Paramecium pentaurelia]